MKKVTLGLIALIGMIPPCLSFAGVEEDARIAQKTSENKFLRNYRAALEKTKGLESKLAQETLSEEGKAAFEANLGSAGVLTEVGSGMSPELLGVVGEHMANLGERVVTVGKPLCDAIQNAVNKVLTQARASVVVIPEGYLPAVDQKGNVIQPLKLGKKVDSFVTSRFPVTRAEWLEVMGDMPAGVPQKKRKTWKNCPLCPVTHVVWGKFG